MSSPTDHTDRTALVIGAGPGLGMSVAHRFGREGFRVALLSRSTTRHPRYLAALSEEGIAAQAFAADVGNAGELQVALDEISAAFGAIDVLYYGPGATDPSAAPEPITESTVTTVEQAMRPVYGAVEVVNHVLPVMLARGDGGLLFAGGLSAVAPMPALGSLALAAAALRTYALTLNAAVAGQGVYAGTLTIGGLIQRGDIHQTITAHADKYGDVGSHTLDPDAIAETAWQMYRTRDRAETTVSAFTHNPTPADEQEN